MKLLLTFVTTGALVSSLAVADTPAIHGMLLFGNNTLYASHLPMFHAPHDYQAIFKLDLTAPASQEALEKYKLSKEAGVTLFTLVPERMDLTTVTSGQKKSFKATVYQGHFERGGTALGFAEVKVEKVVFATKLSANAATQSDENYLLFGEKGEYFAAHKIAGKPSFDFIAQIFPPHSTFDVPCERRVCQEPISTPIQDGRLPVTVTGVGSTVPAKGDVLGSPAAVNAKVESVIYVEHDELSH